LSKVQKEQINTIKGMNLALCCKCIEVIWETVKTVGLPQLFAQSQIFPEIQALTEPGG